MTRKFLHKQFQLLCNLLHGYQEQVRRKRRHRLDQQLREKKTLLRLSAKITSSPCNTKDYAKPRLIVLRHRTGHFKILILDTGLMGLGTGYFDQQFRWLSRSMTTNGTKNQVMKLMAIFRSTRYRVNNLNFLNFFEG